MGITFNLCEDCEGEFLGPHQTDDGIWRCDDHYIKALKSELSELQQKIANATCHRGHKHLPLTLWDCPTCVQNEKKELEAKLAETKKIGEELIDERDDIIASLESNLDYYRKESANYKLRHSQGYKKNVALLRQVEHLMRQVDKLRGTGTSTI